MMHSYQRGDVYLVEEHSVQGGEFKKTRLWVLVGANPINRARSTVMAIPLSTQVKELPGLSVKICINNSFFCAVLDQIRALDKRRLKRFEATLADYETSLIEDGLRQVLCI